MNMAILSITRQVLGVAAKACPFCGTEPGLARQVNGVFLVGCEANECPASPQVGDTDLGRAWTKWNRRAP